MQRMFSDLIIEKGYNLFGGGISKAVWKGIGL